MASPGWAALGSTIAGGNKLNGELAYDQGEALSARTQDALAQARQRVMSNHARETADSALQGVIPDPKTRAAAVNAIQDGRPLSELFTGLKTNQEIGLRTQVADPATADPQVARNLLALGQPAQLVHAVGENGNLTNELHPDQGVQMSDIGKKISQGKALETQASVAEKNSAAERNAASAALTNQAVAGGGKAPAGFRYKKDANGNVTTDLEPMTGGPKDPNAPGLMGSREASFFGRQLIGARDAMSDLHNIMLLPSGTSTGVFGIGASPGHNLLSSTVDTLRNTMSKSETRKYQASITGLSNGLALIESSGLAPGQNFQSTFDALQFREGDTEEDKLYKLAGVRQILENFNEVTQANPRIPDPQKALVTKLAAEAAAAVPFTRKDVIALSNAPPGTSIADIVKAHKLGTPATSAAPAGAAPPAAPPAAAPKVAPATMAFDTAEQAQAAAASGKLKPGTRITVGGTLGTWQ